MSIKAKLNNNKIIIENKVNTFVLKIIEPRSIIETNS